MPYPSKSARRARVLAEGLLETRIAIARPLSKTELGAFLDVSERFLETEVKEGRLRAIRLSNRSVRFLPKDVQAWLDRMATHPAEAV